MKKIITAGLVLLTVFLWGCKPVDIEDRNYVMVIGIDLEGNTYDVTYSVADVSENEGKAGESPSSKIMSYKADNFDGIEKEYNMANSKTLDYGHVKCIILGEEMLLNREKLQEFIDFVSKDEMFSKTVYVYAGINAKDIVSIDENTPESLGVALDDRFEILSKDGYKSSLKLYQLIKKISNNQKITLCSLSIEEENVILDGYYIIDKEGTFTYRQLESIK